MSKFSSSSSSSLSLAGCRMTSACVVLAVLMSAAEGRSHKGRALEEAPAGSSGQRGREQFSFDKGVAQVLGALAEAAYCGPNPEMSMWTCEPCVDSGTELVPGTWRGLHHESYGDKYHTYITLAKIKASQLLEESCVVTIRGTSQTSNWMTNFDFWKMALPEDWQCSNCRVMMGWFNEWMGVEEQVVELLQEIGCAPGGETRLLITGHSMGAAVSTLATYSLVTRWNFSVAAHYTFESPRVGDHTFAQRFANTVGQVSPVFRITQLRDPVPHLPPHWLGYEHVNQEVFFNGTDYVICKGTEDPECSYQYWFYNISQHCNTLLLTSGSFCRCDRSLPMLLPMLVTV